jgi:hypothetical protein
MRGIAYFSKKLQEVLIRLTNSKVKITWKIRKNILKKDSCQYEELPAGVISHSALNCELHHLFFQ